MEKITMNSLDSLVHTAKSGRKDIFASISKREFMMNIELAVRTLAAANLIHTKLDTSNIALTPNGEIYLTGMSGLKDTQTMNQKDKTNEMLIVVRKLHACLQDFFDVLYKEGIQLKN
jgi:tRNA A-37 threonylcarbamoyl transferase component Bud32